MIGFQIVEFCATFIEVLAGIWINANILGEDSSYTTKIVLASSIVTVIAWSFNQYQLFSVFTSAIGIVGIIISAYIVYQVNILDSLVLTIFYLTLIYIIDFFSISVFGLIFKEEQFAKLVASAFSIERVCFIAFSKLLLVGISFVFVKKWLSKVSLPVRKIWVGLILGMFFLYYLVKSTFYGVDVQILWLWFLFLVLISVGVYSAAQYIGYIQEKKELSTIIERNQEQLETYNKLIQNYQANQIFYHDLKNQYLVIDSYLKNREYTKAETYMQELGIREFGRSYKQRTGNQILDILLDYKIKEAKDQQIYVDVSTDVVDVRLTDQELTALMGNMLDNAIEACKEMESGIRWMHVKICRIQEMTFIKVSNSYEQKPQEQSGIFVSLKDNPQAHGLGIKSIRMIAEKYGGKVRINYSKGEFSITVLFFD